MKVDTTNLKTGERYRVWLDGVPQLDAISADDVAGIVVRHARDADGELVLNWVTYSLQTETVRGRVRIARLYAAITR